jgi:tRNA(Ile)-lysidine synthase
MDFSAERLLDLLSAFPAATRYRVAFSGGLDSSVLLHALVSLGARLPAPLSALHLDHGLQAASSRWAQHCAEICRSWRVPLTTLGLAVNRSAGTSLEAEARAARLDAYRGMLGPGEVLLTAQHQDDQAETLLLQLLRGAGLNGLAAMAALAPLGAGWLGRPLLGFRRAQLQTYAEQQGVIWLDDPSNADTAFDRNYLRHRVLPLIAERWPAHARTLARSARHCAEGRDLIDHLAADELPGVRGSRPNSLSVTALSAREPALVRALLRFWIAGRGFAGPSDVQLTRILDEVLSAAPDRSPLVGWPGAQVRRYRDDLFLMPPLPEYPGLLDLVWPAREQCRLPAGLGRLSAVKGRTPGLEPARWSGGDVRIRFGVPGLRCRLPGRRHRIRLKHLFQQYAIPEWVRPFVPLVFLDGELVALAGVALCGPAVVSGGEGVRIRWEGHPFRELLPGSETP